MRFKRPQLAYFLSMLALYFAGGIFVYWLTGRVDIYLGTVLVLNLWDKSDLYYRFYYGNDDD